mmetsp:Transcript_55956/g.120036  ORF Transcript_55956/g.120036 Transcript_55956/m.120036 type:complete len:484 (+) Transcript_55956:346-1797(+)
MPWMAASTSVSLPTNWTLSGAELKRQESSSSLVAVFTAPKWRPMTKKAYIFNGFFMSMRSAYVEKGKAIYYYVVEWDETKLSWADFRGQVCGPTDPSEAPADSLRGAVLAKWEELGLAAKPDTGNNAIHASASPFEGLAERMNWLNMDASKDVFGAPLLAAGVPLKIIKEWARDPQVNVGDKQGSLYDSLEDMNASDCLAKASDLWTINRPRPTGRVSGVEYDFTNDFAKIVAKKETRHIVFESGSSLAFLAPEPACPGHTIVIAKELGFATFLDMPAPKANEFTRDIAKISKVLKEATAATAVSVVMDSGADAGQAVMHPSYQILPRKAGDSVVSPPKAGGKLDDDSAKDLVTKVHAALNPPPPLKRPRFGKVAKIRPDSAGLNLRVKATSDPKDVETKAGTAVEVTVGDDSASVTVSLRDNHKTGMSSGKSYEIRNAGVKMVQGRIHVVVDKWGKIEEVSDSVEANAAKNISETEYELVNA